DCFIPVGLSAGTGHGCRRTDTDHIRRTEALSQPPDKQGNIRTLTPSIRVQLIQNQEIKAVTMLDYTSVCFLITRENKLQHHEVSQKDVRGVRRNSLPFT